MKTITFFIIILFLFGCKEENKSHLKINSSNLIQQKKTLTQDDLKGWHLKDIIQDSIPGISLNRVFKKILKNKEGKETVIAVIDTEVDINHIELKSSIWINSKEIPNNGIDDDNNGYIDDVNGWNFIGNLQEFNIINSSAETVRIIQHYDEIFKNKKKNNISVQDRNKYDLYINAKEMYNRQIDKVKADLKYANFLFFGYPKAKASMKKLFPKEDYTTKQLDSVYKKYKKTNSQLSKDAYFVSDCIKYDISEEWILEYKNSIENKIKTTYNLKYFDRTKIDKNPNDLTFINYGNPYVYKNAIKLYHGTVVSGLIAANRANNSGIKGISNSLKIMPLAISSYGVEHDKDIALAIKYAVDNGARVINMSFSKKISLRKDWVLKALKYAEKNNVLIVSSAGNTNLDLNKNNLYPNDCTDNNNDVVSNFILVGSTSHKINEEFMSYFSNYGNINVDLFAPGENIYTTLPNNKYKFDSGTSLSSAITSGVAGLIFSYYPNLSASQVKNILMNSGLQYNIEVNTSPEKKEKKTVSFSKLSKSGRVLNAYNALIMADSISKR